MLSHFSQKCSSWYSFKSVFHLYPSVSLSLFPFPILYVCCQWNHRSFMICAHLDLCENAGCPKFAIFTVEMMVNVTVKPSDFGSATLTHPTNLDTSWYYLLNPMKIHENPWKSHHLRFFLWLNLHPATWGKLRQPPTPHACSLCPRHGSVAQTAAAAGSQEEGGGSYLGGGAEGMVTMEIT